MATAPIDELKADLRKIALARRDAIPAAERQAAAEAIAARAFPLPIAPGAIVSGFSPLKRSYAFGQALNAGVWGIREPKEDALEVEPDILIVPLAAFDRHGNRIGYGAGYYDLTINRLRQRKPVVAIGIAYAAQEVAEVPATPRDARLDLVLTEHGVIDCRGT
jgi:5-formyltetrahydrofolate cyclo-ligase